jgi:hypothetical protein
MKTDICRGNDKVKAECMRDVYSSVSQPAGRGTVPGPGINYTGLREVLLEVVILVF